MVKQWLKLSMMMALVAGVTVTHAADRHARLGGLKPKMMPIDTCIRSCLACDQGNVVSCAVCALCSEPA